MRKSRLSWYKQTRLIELFVAGSTARTTASYYFHRLRLLIYENSQQPGLLECDESYFGDRRKGKRGRSAGNKVPIFGLLKRNSSVYLSHPCSAFTHYCINHSKEFAQNRNYINGIENF